MKTKYEFGDKVTDVCDSPERNYIVLKRLRGNQCMVINKSLTRYCLHSERLRRGWNRKLGDKKR